MAKMSYALEQGGPKRLIIDSNVGWKDSVVKFDDVEIGRIPDLAALQNGLDFTLPDGSLLHVQINNKLFSNQLRITRNGAPIPDSYGDPWQNVKAAYRMLYLIGGFSILIGFVSIFSEDLQSIGVSWLSVVLGVVFLVLGYFTQRHSKTALIIAIVLFGLDSVLTLILNYDFIDNPITGFIGRLILMVPMVLGLITLNDKKNQEPKNPPTQP